MMERIAGIETEFGCLVRDPALGKPEEVVERVKDQAFYGAHWGLIDRHARDAFFEPAEAGGFLINGGRLYIDVVGSHLEYATPECRSLRDLVAYDKAGRLLLVKLLHELGWTERASFHNNNVDHYGGHTFGCHENYSLDPETHPYGRDLVPPLIPFLVTRQIFAGSGRVGGHRLTSDPRRMVRDLSRHRTDYAFLDQIYGVEPDPTVTFQLSQRADHILYVASGRVRFSRALINPKWDSFQDASRAPRLHILFGESNMSEYATFLKVGTTALVLDTIEERAAPRDLELAHPIRALREISRDPTLRWITRLEDGRTIRAVDLQRRYLEAAQRFLGRDEETDLLLDEWEAVLDGLEKDPLSLADRLDWAAKYHMLELYCRSEGVDWDDPMLHSLDLEYHNVNPAQGLYYALEQTGGIRRLISDSDVEAALYQGPKGTRAQARARIVQALRSLPVRDYLIEWDGVTVGAKRALIFDDPFNTYPQQVERFLQQLRRAR
jgi:proteasome accessory factor A